MGKRSGMGKKGNRGKVAGQKIRVGGLREGGWIVWALRRWT